MPRIRLYATDAERQQAYRLRHVSPPSKDSRPATATTANPWPRWRHLAGDVDLLLSALLAEMEGYQESRSERWQASDKADEFADRLADLAQVQELIHEWITDR